MNLTRVGDDWVWGNGITHPSTPGDNSWRSGEPTPEGSDCAVWQSYTLTDSVGCEEEIGVLCIEA